MTDTRHLAKRGELWMFHWRVPKDCRVAFGGKNFISRSLKTHSLRDAHVLRAMMLADCLKIVLETRRQGDDARTLFKTNLVNMSHSNQEYLESAWLDIADKEPTNDTELAYREALRTTHLGYDSELAQCFLKDALTAYQEEKKDSIQQKTINQAKRAVTVFLNYLDEPDVPIGKITRKTVKDFIKGSQLAFSGKTVSNQVAMLSSVFKVALDDGLIEEDKRNPFEGHRVSRKDTQSYQRFPDTQLKAIFAGTLPDKGSAKQGHRYLLPRLGYATGCRIEELCSLQRAQVRTEGDIMYLAIADGVDTYQGKTLNAGRRIPVHSSLVNDLQAWLDMSDQKYLFPMLESKRADGKMGDKYSKQFGVLKRTLGITERSQAFHSFRVHMATNLERAAVPENRAVWVLGHTRTLSLSYGLYSDGPSLEQLSGDIEKTVVWP